MSGRRQLPDDPHPDAAQRFDKLLGIMAILKLPQILLKMLLRNVYVCAIDAAA
jgi:hypothetical protein